MCTECYVDENRITPLLNPLDCLENHTQYICGTCGRCICIEHDSKRGLKRWNFPFKSLEIAKLYLRTADYSVKKPCGIYEIKSENGRLSYKIFASHEELQLYLKKNKGKMCEKMAPVFIVEEYREYADTQVRKLTSDEIRKYMSERVTKTSYIKNNKEAWEEAFEHRHPGWGEENYRRLLTEELPFFCPDVAEELKQIDFSGKDIAQFCCNNGRELLSLMCQGAKSGTGFDIAENIIGQAVATAKKAGIQNCSFVSCNILDISERYNGSFDSILFTIGAITWFDDLKSLFQVASRCLKPGGLLFLHDFHPVMNMLPMPGEPEFDEQHPSQITYSYFRKEPWIENEGMGYMSEQYASKTFTSFSHTMSDIINAACDAKLRIVKFNEYDYDVGLSDVYDKKGFPLSYLLIAEKI